MGILIPHPPLVSPPLLSYPSFWEVITHVCLLSLSIDSMIRVGGDYQAQIPEFKPGKLGGREGGMRERQDDREEIKPEKET